MQVGIEEKIDWNSSYYRTNKVIKVIKEPSNFFKFSYQSLTVGFRQCNI